MVCNKKILTIGDAMVVFNPSKTGPLRFVPEFTRSVGGAELNFAIGVSRLGMEAKWISRLGEDEFGTHIYNFARGEGVDVSTVSFVKAYPTSIYFKEISESGAGKSFYYRSPSPLLTLNKENLSKSILANIDVLHITGVYLAVCEHNIDVALQLIKWAKECNIIISFDPNLRLKLWNIEQAKKAYEKIYPFIDIFLTGKDEFEQLFGKSQTYKMEMLYEKYQWNQLVLKDGANGAKVLEKGKWYERTAYEVQAVDTVGAGDAFDAAYIYAFLNQLDINECLRIANAAGALMTTVKGDNEGLPTLKELHHFMGDNFIIER